MIKGGRSSTSGQELSDIRRVRGLGSDSDFWPVMTAHGSLSTDADDFLLTYEMEPGAAFLPHAHDAQQLIWTVRGLMRVVTPHSVAILPALHGLWIPPGVRHEVSADRPSLIRTFYLNDLRHAPVVEVPTLVEIDDVLHSVVGRLTDPSVSGGERDNLERVVFDCIRRHADRHPTITMPVDDRAARVARSIAVRPDDPRTADAWGRSVGASARTLSRIFQAETGLSFEHWRRDARMRIAYGMIRDGVSVERCAHIVGYQTSSAFGVAYRTVHGHPPSADAPRPQGEGWRQRSGSSGDQRRSG